MLSCTDYDRKTRDIIYFAESVMKPCNRCKYKTQCAELPGICLMLPRVLVATVAIMVTVLFFNSTL